MFLASIRWVTLGVLSLLCVALLLPLGGGVAAQQRATIDTGRPTTAAVDTRLSREFQAAMNAGDFQRAAALAGTRRTEARASRTGRSGPTGIGMAGAGANPADHICKGGNCACAGAHDCVGMVPHCVPETIGCNDYGCTCKEQG